MDKKTVPLDTSLLCSRWNLGGDLRNWRSATRSTFLKTRLLVLLKRLYIMHLCLSWNKSENSRNSFSSPLGPLQVQCPMSTLPLEMLEADDDEPCWNCTSDAKINACGLPWVPYAYYCKITPMSSFDFLKNSTLIMALDGIQLQVCSGIKRLTGNLIGLKELLSDVTLPFLSCIS